MFCCLLDELHTLIGAGGAEGAMDASNILKPSLARGEIQLIGATTLEEYRKHIEKDAALERRFQPVTVEEPTEEEAIGRFYRDCVPVYEEHHKVTDSAGSPRGRSIICPIAISTTGSLPDKADRRDGRGGCCGAPAADAVRLTESNRPGKGN